MLKIIPLIQVWALAKRAAMLYFEGIFTIHPKPKRII